jgi:hypothetical protein
MLKSERNHICYLSKGYLCFDFLPEFAAQKQEQRYRNQGRQDNNPQHLNPSLLIKLASRNAVVISSAKTHWHFSGILRGAWRKDARTPEKPSKNHLKLPLISYNLWRPQPSYGFSSMLKLGGTYSDLFAYCQRADKKTVGQARIPVEPLQ